MAVDYISSIATDLGVAAWVIGLIVVWSLVWKLVALWKAATKKSLVWFIVLGVINTVGILEILYIFIFSKMSDSKITKRKKKK
jgi:methionyl-tRNA synthetase